MAQQHGLIMKDGLTGPPQYSPGPDYQMPRPGNMAAQHEGVAPQYPGQQQGSFIPQQNISTKQNGTMAQAQGKAPPYSPQQSHFEVPRQNITHPTVPPSCNLPVYAVNQTNGNADTVVLVTREAADRLNSKYHIIFTATSF